MDEADWIGLSRKDTYGYCSPCRIMSIFFFRFHNLRRAEETRKKHIRNTNSRQTMSFDTLTAPSRLHERPLSAPLDSLDEIALQIPRCPQLLTVLDVILIPLKITRSASGASCRDRLLLFIFYYIPAWHIRYHIVIKYILYSNIFFLFDCNF